MIPGHPRRAPRRPLVRLAACAAVILAVGAAACGRAEGGRIVSAESVAADVAIARPAFTLTATDGTPFDFAARTAGRLTFLEFGYTNCPDVCPVHMANLAAVLAKLTPTERMRIDVIFVSVDPDRDSLPALRKWLDSFSASFIGLTGTREAIDAAQNSVGFGPAIVQVAENGTSTVLHAAPVIVFTADDTAHVMYPFGTRQADWERDLPRLLAVPASAARESSEKPAAGAAISRAYVVAPAGDAPVALYFEAHNTGAVADTILAIDAGPLGPAAMHHTMQEGGSVMMHTTDAVAVPANGAVRFAPGGLHGMFNPLPRRPVRGETVRLTVRFARAGTVVVDARVISYADVDTATAPSRP